MDDTEQRRHAVLAEQVERFSGVIAQGPLHGHPRILPYRVQEERAWSAWARATITKAREVACRQLASRFRLFELDSLPQPRDISRLVESCTGFRLRPTTGLLIEPEAFFADLEHRRFPVNVHVRDAESPTFSTHPDWPHEVMHAIALTHPDVAALHELFGHAGRMAKTRADLEYIERLYWFALEVSVVAENGKPRALGAAILSSPGEMANMHRAELRPFELSSVAERSYDSGTSQDVYFEARSFDWLISELTEALTSFLATRTR